MAAIYEYTGVVEKVLQLQTFASGFTKRDVVMTDDVGAESKWPNHIAFTFKKDAASMLDTVREGQRAKIRFAIDGREWTNPQGQVKYFTDLTGLKIEVLNADGSSTEPVPAPAEPDFPEDAGASARRRLGFDPWVRKMPPVEGNGNPLQYPRLGNATDRGA